MPRKADPKSAKIVERYTTSNDKLQTIGDEYGLSKQRIYQILKKAGVIIPEYKRYRNISSKLAPKTKEIIERYTEGVGGEALASEYNVSRWTVYNLLRKSGVTIRRAGPPRKTYAKKLADGFSGLG